MANGIYNNTPLIPGNGADRFGDKLVGNQFTDGTSQFTLGNFEIYSNVSSKDSRQFSLGNFSEPITLDTLHLDDVQQSKLFVSNSLEVFINFNRSKVTNFTQYGSLRERLKVAVFNVIKGFPAAIISNSVRRWSDYNTGFTATNILYEAEDEETFLDVNLYTTYNPFSLEYTTTAKVVNPTEEEEIRNLTLWYSKYSLYHNNIEYPLTYLKPTSGNTTSGSLTIAVKGQPFLSRQTTESFYIKPNTTATEKAFNELGDVEKFLVERTNTPPYTAVFDRLSETDEGTLVKSSVSVTWPSSDEWNIRITGDLFNTYITALYEIGDSFDNYKTNLISRFLTTGALKEFDTMDEKVEKVLQIYGRSFDEVKKYIEGLAYMANVTYDGKNNIPNELLKNFAQTLGWKTPSAIENKGFLDSIFERSDSDLYSGQVESPTPSMLDTELYRRLLMNTAYLFKSKGTRRGIEFMLRFIGAPEALIEFNENVYLAGQPLNMHKFDEMMLNISGGTYTEEVPVKDVFFSALTNTFPTITITGFTYGYETVTHQTKVGRQGFPVDKEGYPTRPTYGPDAYFQAGEGWFEESVEHRGKLVVDYQTSVFTGNTPTLKTKLNNFTYGEPYLDLYRRFPDIKMGFPIVRTTDNKKSWTQKTRVDNRYYGLEQRGAIYSTPSDKLVINVKNVELFLNIGQGLEWGVWSFSKRYSCPFGPTPLTGIYPSYGGPDWTEIVADASKMSFFEFAAKFWRVLINVKNRLTIDDGHGGGYPTLLSIYLDYLNSENTCGIPSTNYTYEKMVEYVENLGGYWMRLVEQFIPATTIWQGGIKYENSIFHRDKFVYKHEPLCDDVECFGSFVTCCAPIFNNLIVEAATVCEMGSFTGASWHNKIVLGGSEYTGNTFYTSTDITDIPSTTTYLEDMENILSGITTNITDPNHFLNYYLINTITKPTSLHINDPNCVVVQGPCGTGEEICDCPPGYEYDIVSDLCLTYTASTVTTGETISAAPGDPGYGAFGARFCVPGSYTTCGLGMPAANFNVIGGAGNPFWDCNGGTTDGRLNQVGVNNPAMVTTTDWFGFSRCIDAPSEGEYLFALAGDDEIRATLNGVTIVHNPWDGLINNRNFNYWWVWPVTLNAGENTLILEGANGTAFGPASFGCEIVGPFSAGTFSVNTDFDIFATQAGIDTYTANTIFSSGDEVGNTFNTQTNTCPSGYTYDLCTDSCLKTVPTTCVTYPEGEDVWNANNGSDPHYFASYICFTLHASSATTGNSTCEYCLPNCVAQSAPIWVSGTTYNYNDIVSWGTQLFIWKSPTSDTTYPPTWVPPPSSGGGPGPPSPPAGPPCWPPPCGWMVYEDMTDIPFLGGNNFIEGEDCSDYEEIPLPTNPEVTGTPYTTSPVTFKDGISNIGGQDCFESTYGPCEELVDPCACTVTWTPDNSHTVYQPGDVVCCPETEDGSPVPNAGMAFILFTDAINCHGPQVFQRDLLCYTDVGALLNYVEGGEICWVPCDTETGSSVLGKHNRDKVEIPTNDATDPCNPSAPPLPPEAGCKCDTTNYQGGDGESFFALTVDLDFYRIDSQFVPQPVMDFYMNKPAEIDEDWWEAPAALYQAGSSPQMFWQKATLNPCCLADNLNVFFKNYIASPGGATVDTWKGDILYELMINDNTLIDFYRFNYQEGDVIHEKVIMHFPNAADFTISGLDNPNSVSGIGNSSGDLTQEPLFTGIHPGTGASTGPTVYDMSSITIQLGRSNAYQVGAPVSLQKYSDSTYLTDNGTGMSIVETMGIRDRYWTREVTGPNIHGAINGAEIQRMITCNGGPLGGVERDVFNMEIQVSCQGIEIQYLQFNLNFPISNTIHGETVPITNPCPTNLDSVIIKETGNKSVNRTPVGVHQSEGNIQFIDINKRINNILGNGG
jgi:hypothetical protein